MAITEFTPPKRSRAARGFRPDARDVRAAIRAMDAARWIMTEDVCQTRQEAQKYIRGWRAAIDEAGGIQDPDGVKAMILPCDANTGEYVDIKSDQGTRTPIEGVIFRFGLAAKSTPAAE